MSSSHILFEIFGLQTIKVIPNGRVYSNLSVLILLEEKKKFRMGALSCLIK